jgi:hypothetical protein
VTIEINNGQPMLQGFYERPFPLIEASGYTIAPMGGAITPDRPMILKIKKLRDRKIDIRGIVHGWSVPFRPVPQSATA